MNQRNLSFIGIFIILLGFGNCNSKITKTNSNSSSSNQVRSTQNRTIVDTILLEAELNKKSAEYYSYLLSNGNYEQIQYDVRLLEIKKIANKLSTAIGNGPYPSNIHLVKYKPDPNAINAFVLPTGEIFIFESIVNTGKETRPKNVYVNFIIKY